MRKLLLGLLGLSMLTSLTTSCTNDEPVEALRDTPTIAPPSKDTLIPLDELIIVFDDNEGQLLVSENSGDSFYQPTNLIKIICKTGEIGREAGSANIEVFGMKLTLMWQQSTAMDDYGAVYDVPQPIGTHLYNGVYWSLHDGHLGNC